MKCWNVLRALHTLCPHFYQRVKLTLREEEVTFQEAELRLEPESVRPQSRVCNHPAGQRDSKC